jgi:D-3-phosphoglycerate dehydrogenase / 2-oxoglutarate reductase
MKILVVGDSYCPAAALRPAFDGLVKAHEVAFVDITDEPGWEPASPSEHRIKEFLGSPRQVIAFLREPDALVVQGAPVTDAVFEAAPSLRLVACARGGPVNVDLAAATERGIPVVTTPGKNAEGVAELTIAFLVMIARRLPEAIRHVESGGVFGHDNYEGSRYFGHDLAGHTLGLVGFGQVGRRVVPPARAFGLRVLVADPYVDAAAIRAMGAEPVDLSTLLARSDFVSLHARLTPETRGMLGRAEFEAMRAGTCFVNTARAELIDEDALVDALAAGRIVGAALDIATPSPAQGQHRLLAFPNVVIVPHIGGSSYETLLHGGEMAAAEIERFLAGQPLLNVANRAALAEAASSSVAAR